MTDADGRLVVDGLPAAKCTVEISYVGFATETQDVDLTANRRPRLAVTLRLDESVSETVTVTASRSRGEVEALNRQKTAQNVVNVLPDEVITSLPNTNVADAIGRLPSVSLERDEGEGKYVQIRGTEPRLSNFEIDGVHIPSPEASVRNVKLDIIPSDLVGSIELHKTLSADQEGDAIGGSVNLITKSAGDQTAWTVSAQGGRTNLLERNLYQVSSTYSTRFGAEGEGGVLLGAGYDWNGRAINDIEPSVDSVDLGQGPVPVFTALDMREYRYQRRRTGFSAALDYRLAPGSSVYARGLLADFQNYGDRWVVSPEAGDFLTPSTTADNGTIGRAVQNRRPHEAIYSLSPEAKTSGATDRLPRLVLAGTAESTEPADCQLSQGRIPAFVVDASNPTSRTSRRERRGRQRPSPLHSTAIASPTSGRGHDVAGTFNAALTIESADTPASLWEPPFGTGTSRTNTDRYSPTGAPS